MKIRLRLIAWFFVIILIILINGIVSSILISNQLKETAIERTRLVTAYFVITHADVHLTKDDFSAENFDEKEKIFSEFFKGIDTIEVVRIKVWSTDATILYSDDKSIVGKNFPDNEHFQNAVKGTIDVNTKPSEDLENVAEKGYEQLMELYIPITLDSDEVVGVIELYTKLDFINRAISKNNAILLRTILISILIILVVVILAFLSIQKFITNPIIRLRDVAREVGKGKLNTKIEVKSEDELGELSSAFNQMTKNLKESRKELEEYNNELETKVEERTKKLKEKLDDLERFAKLTIGREERMIDLKRRIKDLEEKRNE